MEEILLISENFVKNQTNLSDNLSGKLLLPAIREAQEVGLREILGDRLLDKIKAIIKEGKIDEPDNTKYKSLVIESQFFLAYQVASNICMLTAAKIDNAGVLQVSDERMESLSIDDVIKIQDLYQNKADYYKLRIQNYIRMNYSQYQNDMTCGCNSINSNLTSAYSGGLWLGGTRGKMVRRGCGCGCGYDRYEND